MVVFLSTFILGSIVTQYTLSNYFANMKTYEYLANSILILKHNLPGVFEQNIYNATVNGSLWTLPVEFLCYVACYLVWRMGLTKEKIMAYTIPLFAFGYILMHIILTENKLLISALRPCAMFYCGMLLDTYRDRVRVRIQYVLLNFIGIILCTYLEVLEYGIILFLPYILIYVAFGTKKKLSYFGRKYEISYGMYLCAWPIQQTIVMLFGGKMNPIVNFLISIPMIITAGLLLQILENRYMAK